MKPVKRECRELAEWALTIFCNVWKRTRKYEHDLPEDVQGSVDVMGRTCDDILAFMKELDNLSLIQRFLHQDVNKDRIKSFMTSLDKACESFQMSMMPLIITARRTAEYAKELGSISREPHDVYDVSLMSDEEWKKFVSEKLVPNKRFQDLLLMITRFDMKWTTTSPDFCVHRRYDFYAMLTSQRPFIVLGLQCDSTTIHSECNYCLHDFIVSKLWGGESNTRHFCPFGPKKCQFSI
jgi:hypothetical protein